MRRPQRRTLAFSPLSSTAAGVRRFVSRPLRLRGRRHCAGRWNQVLLPRPRRRKPNGSRNLILAWEAAHRQFPTAANIAKKGCSFLFPSRLRPRAVSGFPTGCQIVTVSWPRCRRSCLTSLRTRRSLSGPGEKPASGEMGEPVAGAAAGLCDVGRALAALRAVARRISRACVGA
jgi:hypothetical protein